MSGDVQPRKRKEKRRKKDSEEIPTSFVSDEQLHVHKDASTGGNICAKILFFLLSFVLLVMIGLVLFEYRGSADDETLVPVSKWAPTFDGWLETPVTHDEHADVTESGEQEHGESGEHENESAEGEEHLSEEAGSKEEEDEEEDEEEEQKGSEEEETKSEEEEEAEDEEADKLEDEESEEVDENEIDDRSEEDEQEEDEQEEEEEEEESEEDVYGRDKSEEDLEAENEDADDGEEEEEEEDVEAGREELDDEEERVMPVYHRESNEIDDVLSEIPGITESEEDEEGDNLGRSEEILDKLPKIPGVDIKKIKAASEEESDVPRRKREKEVGGEIKSSRTPQDKTAEEEEEEEGEDEPEPSGVALKFGVGVALVIVAHVVLVKKWNSDENLAAPNTSDAPQSVPQVQQRKISEQIPQILVEPETVKDSEESSYLPSEYITRRQTLLPDDLVHNSPQRELEESESSVPSEEESDDGQEELIFKQNVYKAENAFKASHRDEKPFIEEKPYKQQSFEELMKKYHERSPEGSDLESDEDEQGEEEEEEEEEDDDDRDIEDDDDELDDEDEHENEEQDEDEISEHKGQGSKISTTPDTEGTSPRKFVIDTQKEQRIAPVEQGTGNRKEDVVLAGGKEGEEHEEEDAGELDSEDDSLGENFKNYQLSKTRKLQREEDDDSGSDKEIPVTKSKIPKNMGGQNAQVYSKADITNEDDWHIIQDLDRADDDVDENPEVAIHRYDTILKSHPNSPRAWYGKATALDQLAAKKRSNFILDQAIDAYKKVTSELSNVKDKLFILAAERCIDRMRFRGVHGKAVPIHKSLMARFPDNPDYQNQLAVTYLMINRNPEAKQVLENLLQKWPRNGFAQVHYGFILKTGNYSLTEAVRYLKEGIATREPGTIDGRFFFQLGDALMRLGQKKEAEEVNELGVKEGLFLSKYQRSLYNVNRLRAQPWWTPDETTYAPYFRKLEENWKQIKEEGVKALYEKNKNLFREEAENLKDSGKWQQLELFARGRKSQTNCAKTPLTCKLIDEFPAARDCRRGQVKFSVLDPGTHIWPHCGPTNCRLRAHLGLVVPKNTFIRVADKIRSWEEGKLFVFDDSFEHEVWHNGTATRVVLIVDVWHPELTAEEKRTLPGI